MITESDYESWRQTCGAGWPQVQALIRLAAEALRARVEPTTDTPRDLALRASRADEFICHALYAASYAAPAVVSEGLYLSGADYDDAVAPDCAALADALEALIDATDLSAAQALAVDLPPLSCRYTVVARAYWNGCSDDEHAAWVEFQEGHGREECKAQLRRIVAPYGWDRLL